MERRWHPWWEQAKGPMLWVPGEPRCDFMCSAERKSLRTPACRQGRQAKRNAIVGGGGGGGGGGGEVVKMTQGGR
jgi:hypothetical protein